MESDLSKELIWMFAEHYRKTLLATFICIVVMIILSGCTVQYKSVGIEGYITIYKDEGYNAFPNVVQLQNGDLACFFRHAPDRKNDWGITTHIDPDSKNIFIINKNWGEGVYTDCTIPFDDANIGEQDPCVTVLSNGRIIMSTFQWKTVPEGQGTNEFSEELFHAYGHTISEQFDAYNIGFSCTISDDNGKTWRHNDIINPDGYVMGSAVHGNITELLNGGLLLPFYGRQYVGSRSTCGIMISHDEGETWEFLSNVPAQEGKDFYEPNIYYIKGQDTLVMLIRTQPDPSIPDQPTYYPMHISFSYDAGRTWSQPSPTSVMAQGPISYLLLNDSQVLLTYGYRQEPYSIRGIICKADLSDIDESEEFVIQDGIASGDLGYTSNLRLADGRVLVAYYRPDDNGIRYIEGAYLRLK